MLAAKIDRRKIQMSKLMGVDLLYYKVGLQTDAHIDTIKGMNDRMCIGMWIGKCLFEKIHGEFWKAKVSGKCG